MASSPAHEALLSGASPPGLCDAVVVGGGIVGLAVARELSRRRPSASIWLLERERRLAAQQTGHNSGVIHAGVYYAPGSLKARLCVEGARELYRHCEERGIPFRRCGKLIVASDRAELPALHELHRRALANGVAGLRLLDQAGIAEIEPCARGVAALHSPSTGVVDFAAVARSYADDLIAAGATIALGCEVRRAREGRRSVLIEHEAGTTEARCAIFCAGAWSDRLAVASGAPADPRIVPFRGAYMRLRRGREELVRGLIYPVPDPKLPFLGVHLTRTIADEVLVGPTALLAGSRRADGPSLNAGDLLDTVVWPGFWRMLRGSWRAAASESRQALGSRALARAAARHVPDLRPEDLEPAFVGVRAQALGRDGTLIDDFAFSHAAGALHVRNAPSPGATSALAIARHLLDAIEAGERGPGLRR